MTSVDLSRSSGLRDRLRARIPSFGHFITRARRDWRLALYDLLPLVATPRLRNDLAGWIVKFRPKTKDFTPGVGLHLIDAELARSGITQALPPIDSETVATLRRYFAPETEARHFDTAEILVAPGLLELLNAPDILAIAELYLGCKPLLDQISVSWTFGGQDVSVDGQRYHRSFDTLRGLKLFIYLSDFGLQAGPPVFMCGSHTSPLLGTGKAQSDATIHALFGAENEIAMTGGAGTRLLVDNFGFHKEALPQAGMRLMVTAAYNIHPSPHAPRPPVLKSAPAGMVLDRDVNRLYVG